MQRRVEMRIRLPLAGPRTVQFTSRKQGRLPLRRRKDVRPIRLRGIPASQRSTARRRTLLRKIILRRRRIRFPRPDMSSLNPGRLRSRSMGRSRGPRRNIDPRRRRIPLRSPATSSRNIILLRSRNIILRHSRNIILLRRRNIILLRSRSIMLLRRRVLSPNTIQHRSRGPSRRFIRLRRRTMNRVPRLTQSPGNRTIGRFRVMRKGSRSPA
jgi:hypothetical protein